VFSVLAVSCSNDDNEGGDDNQILLKPISIKITERIDISNTEYSEYTFSYDNIDTLRIVQYDVYWNKNKEKSANIVYNDKGQAIEVECNNQYRSYIIKYEYVPTADSELMYVNRIMDGNITGSYVINQKGQLISKIYKTTDDEMNIVERMYNYSYSKTNLISIVNKVDDKIYLNKQLYYNLNNGVFRNVSTPQWFLLTELDMVCEGQIKNNCKRYTEKRYIYKDDELAFEDDYSRKYVYSSFIKNFPSEYKCNYVIKAGGFPTSYFNVSDSYEVRYNITK